MPASRSTPRPAAPRSEVVDLAGRRAQRARAKAARREGRGEQLVLQFDGTAIATLGPEFPLDVLEPLQHVHVDLPLLIRQAIDMFNAAEDEAAGQTNVLTYVVEILAVHPNLPGEIIATVKEMAKRLLGEAGYEAYVATRPSPWDVADLVSALIDWYGLSLGESQRPINSSDGGPTSNTTSSTTSGSTPEVSGPTPAAPASSESAA